ncbi:TadE/TadG family type IV pilus assembly protein [Sphingomonas sp. Xoc002]|uniref:TadE/TadG family type IV pilus assembly protein n=1 Tax=Sphingomonas sp. Xoc002 TaxID=2837624 RepID=UPI003D1666EE
MFRALRGDKRGVALVEFAIILPVMLILYLGGVQLQDAMACKRKVTITARAAVDLIAQNTTGKMTEAEIGSNLIAASQVMQPYADGNAQIRVTEVSTDRYGRTWIIWSEGRNTQGYPRGARANVPAAMGTPGTTFLVAQVGYPYRPVATFGGVGAMTLSDILWMVPRNADQIACSDC